MKPNGHPRKGQGRGGARFSDRASRIGELPRHARSRITNGLDILPYVDGRSGIAKRYRDIAEQLVVDQGGDLSESRLQLVRRFAGAAVLAEQIEALIVTEQPVRVEEYAQLISVLVRVAARIGLDRIPKNVTPSLRDYLEEREADS